MYYSTKIFESAGAVMNAAFASSVWVGLINLIFTFVAVAFVDRLGRRPLLLGCVVLFIAAFAMTMGPITWLFCSEIFPDQIRGRAMSVAAFVIWVACHIVTRTFPMMNDSAVIGPAVTFWVYGAVSLASFFFVLVMIPETKGRTLEEIGRMWKPAELTDKEPVS